MTLSNYHSLFIYDRLLNCYFKRIQTHSILSFYIYFVNQIHILGLLKNTFYNNHIISKSSNFKNSNIFYRRLILSNLSLTVPHGIRADRSMRRWSRYMWRRSCIDTVADSQVHRILPGIQSDNALLCNLPKKRQLIH